MTRGEFPTPVEELEYLKGCLKAYWIEDKAFHERMIRGLHTPKSEKLDKLNAWFKAHAITPTRSATHAYITHCGKVVLRYYALGTNSPSFNIGDDYKEYFQPTKLEHFDRAIILTDTEAWKRFTESDEFLEGVDEYQVDRGVDFDTAYSDLLFNCQRNGIDDNPRYYVRKDRLIECEVAKYEKVSHKILTREVPA